MKNLAGVEDADKFIRAELEEACIPVVSTYAEKHPEVPYSIGGELFGWRLRRQWYYWSVHKTPGLPLVVARRMFDLDPERNIRVAGHCACPPPEEWTEKLNAKGYRVIPHPEKEPPAVWKRMGLEHGMNSWDLDTKYEYVDTYHIDTQEGLNLCARIICETEAQIFDALRNTQ